jgi:hypothetical protein
LAYTRGNVVSADAVTHLVEGTSDVHAGSSIRRKTLGPPKQADCKHVGVSLIT